ncbi:MAG: DUF2442 domain-containing protein [Burkholderiaceae bacterium]
MSTLAASADPRALSARCTDDELIVQLADGRTLAVPLVWFPRLAAGTQEARNKVALIGSGDGLHWPVLDEDISVAGLLAGRASVEHSRMRA